MNGEVYDIGSLRRGLEASWRAWQRIQYLGGVEARLAIPEASTRAGELLAIYKDARLALNELREIEKYLRAVLADDERIATEAARAAE